MSGTMSRVVSPNHTVESVTRELAQGLSDGTITLPGRETISEQPQAKPAEQELRRGTPPGICPDRV